jgi:hypothetical protein
MLVPPASRQSKAPSSPDDANMLCPCAAICSKITFSACAKAAPVSFSHRPQLELTASAVSALAIRLYSSN